MKHSFLKHAYLLSAIVMAAGVLPSHAQSFISLGVHENSTLCAAEAVSAPQPQIPAHLQEQCFKSCCIARFFIKSNGKASVRLLTSSGCDEVDEVTLDTLQRWRFRPATLNGKPVDSTRKIRVEFEIE